MKKLINNTFYLGLPLLTGGIVALLTKNNMDYSSIVKPVLSPPGIVFPIAWTILYGLMGLSFYLYKRNSFSDPTIDKYYYTQLVINALWSIIFFNLKNYLLAFIWILLLDVVIYLLLRLFKKHYKNSYYLNIPYFIWCLFATYLSFGVFLLN